MGSAEPVAPRPRRRGAAPIALALGVVVAGLLVWATVEATTPGRDQEVIHPASIRVAALAPGTANFALRGIEPGTEDRAAATVTYVGAEPAEVRLFTVPTIGPSQSLAPDVELVIDDPADGAPPWTGTLDELRSLNSFDAGVLPSVMSPGDRREFIVRYSIAADADPTAQASAVLVWRAEPER